MSDFTSQQSRMLSNTHNVPLCCINLLVILVSIKHLLSAACIDNCLLKRSDWKIWGFGRNYRGDWKMQWEFAVMIRGEAGSSQQRRKCRLFREVGRMEGVGGRWSQVCVGFMHSGRWSFKNVSMILVMR